MELSDILLYGIQFLGVAIALWLGNTTENWGLAWWIGIGSLVGGLIVGGIVGEYEDFCFKEKMASKEKYEKEHSFEIAKERFSRKDWRFDEDVDWTKYYEVKRELKYLDDCDKEDEEEVIIYLLRGDDEYIDKYIEEYEQEFSAVFTDAEKKKLRAVISVKNEQRYKECQKTIEKNKKIEQEIMEEQKIQALKSNNHKQSVRRKHREFWLNSRVEIHGHKLIELDNDNGVDCGFCLDLYTYESTKLDDGKFKNKYSKLGQMIHDLKYTDMSDDEKMKLIKDEMVPEIIAKTNGLSLWDMNIAIIPMPFSKERTLQPVYELAKVISDKKQKPVLTDVLHKSNNIEAKKTIGEFEDGVFTATYFGEPISVLIIDDTYGRGRSLRASVRALRKNPEIENIYYMGIVKNRNGGLVG